MPGACHVDASFGNLPGKLKEVRYATRESIRLYLCEGRPPADHQDALARKAQTRLCRRNCRDKDVLALLEIKPGNADERELVQTVARTEVGRELCGIDRVRLHFDRQIPAIESIDVRRVCLGQRNKPVALPVKPSLERKAHPAP